MRLDRCDTTGFRINASVLWLTHKIRGAPSATSNLCIHNASLAAAAAATYSAFDSQRSFAFGLGFFAFRRTCCLTACATRDTPNRRVPRPSL
jgi:hypothetical protein